MDMAQVEALAPALDFTQGVDHMNQVISYDRLVYFGYIFESSGLKQDASGVGSPTKTIKPPVAFGARVVNHRHV